MEELPEEVFIEYYGKPREEMTIEDLEHLQNQLEQQEQEQLVEIQLGVLIIPSLLLTLALIFRWFNNPLFWIVFVVAVIVSYLAQSGKINIEQMGFNKFKK